MEIQICCKRQIPIKYLMVMGILLTIRYSLKDLVTLKRIQISQYVYFKLVDFKLIKNIREKYPIKLIFRLESHWLISISNVYQLIICTSKAVSIFFLCLHPNHILFS